jgi:hypothetical protein
VEVGILTLDGRHPSPKTDQDQALPVSDSNQKKKEKQFTNNMRSLFCDASESKERQWV